MPELPEVESARALAERWTVGREIVDADDRDAWVCRPHPPGEIAASLRGRTVTGVGRIGKSLWLDLDDGHRLGLHLGMAGRLVGLAVEGAGPERPDDELPETAGEPLTAAERASWSMPLRRSTAADHAALEELPGERSWTRFALDLDDGGRLLLFDKRRLARVRLDPDLAALGPDALTVDAETFAARVGRGGAPLKARLMDQSVIAGIGNLLCDELLWQAPQPPLRPAGDLSADELAELHEVTVACTREAIARGGVHLGDVIPHRRRGEHCPRCGAPMARGRVGGRTTWWCSREQAWPPTG